MSYFTMPALPIAASQGLKKTPHFNTVLQKTAASRGNTSVSLKPYPTWDYELSLEHIQGNEGSGSVLATVLGTFMKVGGSNGLFLFTDPQDSSVAYATGGMLNVSLNAASPMGSSGDGTSTVFQLARQIGGLAWDILQNVVVTGVQVNGVNKAIVTDYTLSPTGQITFQFAPVNGATLTWQGTFQYLCRWDSDVLDAVREFTRNSGTDNWSINSIRWSTEFQ